MSERIVDIHVSARKQPRPDGSHIDEGLGKWFRPTLALAVAELGLEQTFSRGKQAYDFEAGQAEILRPQIKKIGETYQVMVTPEFIAIDSISAIRNIAPALGNGMPELNDPAVRSTARDKAETNTILNGIYLGKKLAAIDSGTGIEAALEAVNVSRAVLKPNLGKGSNKVTVGDKRALVDIYNTEDFDKTEDWIVEELLDMSSPIPSIKGASASDQDKLDHINRLGLPKELRIYTFGHDDKHELITSAVLRAALPEHQSFYDNLRIYLDQNSVPRQLYQKTDEIVRAFQAATGVAEMHLAVDWTYAIVQGETEPRWLPMEVNGTEPVLIYENENHAVSQDQAAKLAAQLYRIAQRQSVKKEIE